MNSQEVVLITGSSGYLGNSLAERLSQSYQVVGLDQGDPKEKLPGVVYYNLDITSEEDVLKTLREVRKRFGPRLTSVIHLVAYYSFAGENDPRYDTITVEGTKSLFTALKNEFQVEQFIFSSSALVYAPVELGKKITDDSPVLPTWPYPQSKVKTEKILQEIHGDIPVVNLRMAGIYNDSCHAPSLANQIIRIYEGWLTSAPFPGNPDHGQSFLHIDDLVDCIERFVSRRHSIKGFENFVLGEEKVMSYRELQEEIGLNIHLRRWPVIKIPAFVATFGAKMLLKMPVIREPFIRPWMIPHSDENLDVDISKVKKLLDWSPKRSLEKKLPVMLEKLKTDPESWYATNKIEKPFYRSLKLINTDKERNQWSFLVFNIFLGMLIISGAFYNPLPRFEFWSEIISGVLICLLSVISLVPTLRWVRWINASVGSWLMFSPLAFHVPEAAAYSTDTILGALVILCCVYSPSHIRRDEKNIPLGWTYNPSTAGERIPIMFLAFIGFILSRYLAAFQLGHIDQIWDPFFGNGTEIVLTSSISKAFPVSDAGLGAYTYLLDVIVAAIGGRDRWRSMPWAVILFGFFIIPTGVTSVVLVMLQPIGVGAWCTVCLLTALIMLIMVPPAVDEVLASVQFLRRAQKNGHPFWRTFWLGIEGTETETEKVVPKIEPRGSLIHVSVCVALGA